MKESDYELNVIQLSSKLIKSNDDIQIKAGYLLLEIINMLEDKNDESLSLLLDTLNYDVLKLVEYLKTKYKG